MKEHHFWQILLAIAAVYLTASYVNIMDVDAAQYAAMSREMLESGSFLQVKEHGLDYLDKPPLVFWLSSLSIWAFGATNFAYKFPSFLFALLAVYSTYRFTKIFYNITVSQLAAVVLASAQALFTITNDCRTDTLLMGSVAFAIWQLAEGFEKGRWQSFLWGFIGLGFGLLAKGPVAVIIPVLAFGTHFIAKKQYKNFFRLEYVWGLGVIALILLPMCVGLYRQFDSQPEKNTSGLRFFFWTQSFGRITGENTWQNDVDFFFLLNAMLWSFAPWILFFLVGFIYFIVDFFRKKTPSELPEMITLGGFILGYASLASSKYQLPHYVFILYPFAAVITARFIVTVLEDKKRWILSKILRGLQWFIVSILWALPFLVLFFVFPNSRFPLLIMAILAGFYVFLAIKRREIVQASVFTVVSINLFMNIYFYPNLLTYQDSSEVGKFITERQIPKDKFFTYQYPRTPALHFYARRIIKDKNTIEQVTVGDWLLTDKNGLEILQKSPLSLEIVKTGDTFYVTALNAVFLNEKTRYKAVGEYFLVRVLSDVKK